MAQVKEIRPGVKIAMRPSPFTARSAIVTITSRSNVTTGVRRTQIAIRGGVASDVGAAHADVVAVPSMEPHAEDIKATLPAGVAEEVGVVTEVEPLAGAVMESRETCRQSNAMGVISMDITGINVPIRML